MFHLEFCAPLCHPALGSSADHACRRGTARAVWGAVQGCVASPTAKLLPPPGWNVAASDISSVPGRKWILHLTETEQESAWARCNYLNWNWTSELGPTPLLVWNFLFSFEHHETESSNLDFIPRMDFTYYWVYVLFWSCKVLLEYRHRIFKPQLLWLVWNWRKVPSSLDFLRHFLHHSRFPFQVVPCSDPASAVSSDWGLEQSPFPSPGWEGQCEGQVWYRILVPNVISERFTPLSLPCPQLILKYKNCCQLSGYEARENDAKNVTNVGQQGLYQVCFGELWRD